MSKKIQNFISSSNLNYRHAVLRPSGIEFAVSLNKWKILMESDDYSNKKLGLAFTLLALSAGKVETS